MQGVEKCGVVDENLSVPNPKVIFHESAERTGACVDDKQDKCNVKVEKKLHHNPFKFGFLAFF